MDGTCWCIAQTTAAEGEGAPRKPPTLSSTPAQAEGFRISLGCEGILTLDFPSSPVGRQVLRGRKCQRERAHRSQGAQAEGQEGKCDTGGPGGGCGLGRTRGSTGLDAAKRILSTCPSRKPLCAERGGSPGLGNCDSVSAQALLSAVQVTKHRRYGV